MADPFRKDTERGKEEMERRWGSEDDFPWERLRNLATEPKRVIELNIVNGKPLPYIRGTFATVWDQMDPGDSFFVSEPSHRRAALMAAKRHGYHATSDKEKDGWRIWLVSKMLIPEQKVEHGIMRPRTNRPLTEKKAFTLGDGPAKYVYASDYEMLETQLRAAQRQIAKNKKDPAQKKFDEAVRFIESVAKSRDKSTATSASVWLMTHKPKTK